MDTRSLLKSYNDRAIQAALDLMFDLRLTGDWSLVLSPAQRRAVATLHVRGSLCRAYGREAPQRSGWRRKEMIVEKQELQDLGWCILEVMGHRKLGGQVREVALAGGVLLRIDIPGDPPMTQFYGATSLFCLTPTTEEVARAVAARYAAPPVQRWELTAVTKPPPDNDDWSEMPPDAAFFCRGCGWHGAHSELVLGQSCPRCGSDAEPR